MCALGSDCKHFALAAHQQDLGITDPSQELAAIGEPSCRDTLREIGAS
jgi:hypothetical protein